MKVIGHFEERIFAPQHSDGHDWGSVGFILLKFGEKRLIWRGSGSHWSGIGMRSTHPSSMTAVRVKTQYSEWGTLDITEGGRLSKKRLEELLPKIREAMGMNWITMKHLDTKRSFVVDRVEA